MRYTYKVTDIEALEKAHPDAVEVIKTVNRVNVGKIWKAAQLLKVSVPGLEAIDTQTPLEQLIEKKSDALTDVPAHMAKATNA